MFRMAKIVLMFVDRCFYHLRLSSHKESMGKLNEMEEELQSGANRDAKKIASDFSKILGDMNISISKYKNDHVPESVN